MKQYEIIEHTADVGIKAFGKDLKELFANAAAGMFEIISSDKLKGKSKRQKFEIQKQVEGLENLLVEWLGELLFLSSTKSIVFEEFDIQELDENHIKAVATGSDLGNYRIDTEIKAVTYHMLEVRREKDTWQAEVIFDA